MATNEFAFDGCTLTAPIDRCKFHLSAKGRQSQLVPSAAPTSSQTGVNIVHDDVRVVAGRHKLTCITRERQRKHVAIMFGAHASVRMCSTAEHVVHAP